MFKTFLLSASFHLKSEPQVVSLPIRQKNDMLIKKLLDESTVLSRPDSNEAKAHFEQSKKVAGEIKEKNLFIFNFGIYYNFRIEKLQISSR